jgi:type IV secretion system protein VirD4
MLLTALRNPGWAILSILPSPVRTGKYVIGVGLVAFAIGVVLKSMAGGQATRLGFPPGTAIHTLFETLALVLVGVVVLRMLTGSMVQHFGDKQEDTHGSARFATSRETSRLVRTPDGLLIGRDIKTGKPLRYGGPAHLLTMAPTRTGKGVGTIIPNLLTASRSVICINPKSKPDAFTVLLARMQDTTAAGGLIARAANRHRGKDNREAAGVLSAAQRHTHFLDSPRMTAVLDRSDFAFGELKSRPATVFLVLPPDRLGTYAVAAPDGHPELAGHRTHARQAGVNDHDSARLVSDLLGQQTVVFQTISRALDSEKSGLSFSEQHTGRSLLTPDEVRNLPQSRELLFLAGLRPIVADKLRYYDDPEFAGSFDPA